MTPRLVVVYARRFEPDWLVDDMVANVSPWADDVVCVDDRDRDPGEAWGHEGRLRARQYAAAVNAGADWALIVDPDERLEDSAGEHIRPLLEQHAGRYVVLRLRLRELFRPGAYRVDGKWGLYRRGRLWPVLPEQEMSGKPIHTPPCPVHPHHAKIDIDVNLYHLKMIEPANRAARARHYTRAETQLGARRRRWDALRHSGPMRLQPIPPGRSYSPAYTRPYLLEQR